MSTPKNSVTTIFLSLINDRDLVVDLTDEQMTELLDLYLNDSSKLRFKACTKDLTDEEAYDFHTDTFAADGISKVYTITQYPSTPNASAINYVCTVNGVAVDYTFNSTTLQFTLDALPDADDAVVCGYEFVGQFNEDLTDEEIHILAHGMLLSYFSSILLKHENMKNSLSMKDYNAFSPANLLDKLTTIKKELQVDLRNLIVSYTFNDFEGFRNP